MQWAGKSTLLSLGAGQVCRNISTSVSIRSRRHVTSQQSAALNQPHTCKSQLHVQIPRPPLVLVPKYVHGGTWQAPQSQTSPAFERHPPSSRATGPCLTCNSRQYSTDARVFTATMMQTATQAGLWDASTGGSRRRHPFLKLNWGLKHNWGTSLKSSLTRGLKQIGASSLQATKQCQFARPQQTFGAEPAQQRPVRMPQLHGHASVRPSATKAQRK